MRVEFYEYSKLGYAGYSNWSDHIYKYAKILDFILAVLGSYISFIDRVEKNIYYILPKPIDLNMLLELKESLSETLRRYSDLGADLDAISTYKVASYMLSKGIETDTTIGELITIDIGGNKYVMMQRSSLGSYGWINLLKRLDKKSRDALKIIVNALDNREGKSRSYLYKIIYQLFKYVQCNNESIYIAVRSIEDILHHMEMIEKGKSVSDEWRSIYNYFNRSQEAWKMNIESLKRDLGGMARVDLCGEVYGLW